MLRRFVDERVRSRYDMRRLARRRHLPIRPRPVVTARQLRPWHAPGLVDDLSALDQTVANEHAWMRRHLALDYRGSGEVVELGTWMGAATAALADGLALWSAARPGRAASAVVQSFDQFRFQNQSHILALCPSLDYVEGASFKELVERRLASRAAHIQLHEVDLAAPCWDTARSIEVLVQDAAKSWEIWLQVRRCFYAALQPGAVIVEQDFAHAYTPWLHLSHYRWRAHLDVLGQIPATTSVVFRVRERLPAALLAFDDLSDGFTPREIQSAFDWSESLVGAGERESIRAARIQLYLLHGDLGVAADLVLEAWRDHLFGAEVLETVRHLGAVAEAGQLTSEVHPEAIVALTPLVEQARAGATDGELLAAVRPLARHYLARRGGHPLRTKREAELVRSMEDPARAEGRLWCAR